MTSESTTPRLGLIKGILIILFGLITGLWLLGFTVTLYPDYTGPEPFLIGLAWFVAALGICTWRGVLAIHRRNREKVSPVTIGVWALLIITAAVWLFSML